MWGVVMSGCVLPAAASAEPLRPEHGHVSVGEGAQDLAGRFRIQARLGPRPWTGFEMHCDAGDATTLLGPATQYFRFQPLLMVGVAPSSKLEMFAGAGLGGARVLEGVCSDSGAPCEGLAPGSRSVSTWAARIGARYARASAPLRGLLRVDAVPHEGATAVLLVGLELGAPAPRGRF